MSVRVAKSGLYAWDDTKTTGEREWREVHGFGMQVQVRILSRSRQSPRLAGVCACMLLVMIADHALRVYLLAVVSQEGGAAPLQGRRLLYQGQLHPGGERGEAGRVLVSGKEGVARRDQEGAARPQRVRVADALGMRRGRSRLVGANSHRPRRGRCPVPRRPRHLRPGIPAARLFR